MSILEKVKKLGITFFELSQNNKSPIEVPSDQAAQNFIDGVKRNKSDHEYVLAESLKALPERTSDIKLWVEDPVAAQSRNIDLTELLDELKERGGEFLADELSCLLMAQYEIQINGQQPVQFFNSDAPTLACSDIAEAKQEALAL